MNKRKFLADEDEPMLGIRLAHQAGEPLQAEERLLRMFSMLCRRLPADSDVWDLSNLLIDGQPVSRETVVAWLNKAHKHAYSDDDIFQQQEPDPCKTFTGLYQLLAFTDAVDATKAMLNACVVQLGGLQLHAQLGEQQLQLESDGRAYYSVSTPALQLQDSQLVKGTRMGNPAANEAEFAAFKAQAAAQTEQLLFMAYKLQLAPLIERLHSFLPGNMQYGGSILHDLSQTVFSERVLDAAVGANQLGRQAWVDTVLQQRCGLLRGPSSIPGPSSPSGWSQLFRPLDLTEEQKRPMRFKAELTRDFMGADPGTVVDVELDLFSTALIRIGTAQLRAQLLLGCSVIVD